MLLIVLYDCKVVKPLSPVRRRKSYCLYYNKKLRVRIKNKINMIFSENKKCTAR